MPSSGPFRLLLLMRTLLTPLLLILCVLTSRGDEFETDVPPKFTFTEVYNDRIVLGDPEFGDYEIIPDTSIKVTAVCSMKGVDLEEIDENTTVSIDFEGLVETWFLSEDPDYVKGDTSATIPLFGFDYVTGEDIQIGQVSVVWTSKLVTITISAKDDPDSYQIMGQDRAFDGDENPNYTDFTTVSLSFGDRELSARTVYVTGSIAYVDYETEEIFETLARVNVKGAIDFSAPVIQMLKPAAGAQINDPAYVLRGTVSDDNGVASVFVQFNDELEGEAVLDAAGNWSIPAIFVPGQNTIKVRAVDQDGNLGTLKPRSIVFIEASDLLVKAAGTAAGRVTSDIFATINYFPGQPSPERVLLRNDGQKTVLNAIPAADALFKEWTSNQPLTNPTSPRLSFSMQQDMEVTAHFVPNIFLPVKGNYTGLLESDSPLGRGGFMLNLGKTGSFTGKVNLGKTTVRLKGKFDTNGQFTGVVKAGGQNFDVILSLARSTGGSNQIVGTFQPQAVEGIPAVAFESAIVSDLATYSKKVKVSPELAGAYNALITPTIENDDTNFPAGHGFARVVVSKLGVARFVGKLGDGTAFSTGAKLSSENAVSLYVPLYKKAGSLAGRLKFDLTALDHDLSGFVDWFRPASTTSTGFTGSSRVEGVKYSKPLSGQRLFLNPDGAGEILIFAPARGELSLLDRQSDVTLSAQNQLTASDTSLGLEVTFKTATGLFSGKFIEQAGGKPLKFSGAVLRGGTEGEKGNVAGGWFSRGSTTGSIRITPPFVPVP